MLFVGYKRCSTSNRAQAWLDDKKAEYTFRDIKENNPSLEELRSWYKRSGQPLKRLFNTSGLMYKELGIKDKLAEMSEEAQLELLATSGLLVKRPILVTEDFVMFGFKEAEWECAIGK